MGDALNGDGLTESHWVKRATLFPKNSKLDSKKTVSFTHEHDITCTIRYDEPEKLPEGVASVLNHVQITGIEKFAAEMKEKFFKDSEGEDHIPKVSLVFQMDASGLANLVRAEASVEEVIPVKEEEPKEEEEKETEDKENEGEDDKTKKTKKSKKGKKDNKPKKRVHTAKLEIIQDREDLKEAGMTILPMLTSEKKESIAVLRELQRQDDIRREKADAANALESYLYSARDQLTADEEEISTVASEEETSKILKEIEDTEEWLYDEADVTAVDYKQKHRSIQDQVDAIQFRLTEKEERPLAITKARNFIKKLEKEVPEWEESKAYILATERDELLKKGGTFKTWLVGEIEKQDKLTLFDMPSLTSIQVGDKLRDLKNAFKRLSRKPVPPPPAPEPEEKDADDKGAEKASEETTETSDDSTKTESTEEAQEADDQVKDELR